MTKKGILIFSAILIVGVLIIIFLVNKKDNKILGKDSTNELTKEDIKYDNESELYYLKDKETNEIIGTSKYEEDMEFYLNHPDYNPNPLQQRDTEILTNSVN